MGLGFPLRLLRSAFGPRYENEAPVKNPRTQIGDSIINALLWQVAGMNGVVPRAALVATWDTSEFVISHQWEAWNSNKEQSHPALTRVSAGVYRYDFAVSYQDEAGESVAVNLLGPARCEAWAEQDAYGDRLEARAWRDPDQATRVHIR